MGLRRLLSRQPAEEAPLELLAELGVEVDPTAPNAQLNGTNRAAPTCPVVVEKKPPVGVGGFRREGHRPSYVWLSEKSRRGRTEWADQLFRPF